MDIVDMRVPVCVCVCACACMVPLSVTACPHAISVCKVANPFIYGICCIYSCLPGLFWGGIQSNHGIELLPAQPKRKIHHQNLGFNFHNFCFCDGNARACFKGPEISKCFFVHPIQKDQKNILASVWGFTTINSQ